MSTYWLLKVGAKHFDSFSVWQAEKTPDGPEWKCVDPDAYSRWMVGKHVSEVGDYLKKNKYQYTWIREDTADVTSSKDDIEKAWREKISCMRE